MVMITNNNIYHMICILIIIPNSMITVILDPVIGRPVLSDRIYSPKPPVTTIQNLSFDI